MAVANCTEEPEETDADAGPVRPVQWREFRPVENGELIGHYTLRRLLVDDTTGVVWVAADASLDREVAIRFPPRRLWADADALSRFERCARNLSRLDHPCLTKVHGMGEHNGVPYVVNGFEGERTLATLIEEGRRIDDLQVLEIGLAISSALAAGARVGLVHGALAPSAIVFNRREEPRLTNLGYSNWSSEHGTADAGDASILLYASPELCAGFPASAGCDVWGLGATLHHALSGRPPFAGDDAETLARSVSEQEAPPLDTPDCPGLALVLARALEKSPAGRYSSVEELHTALEEVDRQNRETQPVTPISTPRMEQVRKMNRRSWGYAAMGALGGAAGAWLWITNTGGESYGPRSLAVLPLRSLSAGSGEDFFADGMTEELITSLAAIEALRVISRTSVMQFKERSASIREVADQLGVEYVLDGSVQREGERVRIQMTLIDAKQDRNIWVNSYDRDLTDVFGLQSDVARAVADEIRVQLTPEEKTRLAASKDVRPQSFEAYLRGLYLLNQRTTASLEEARDLFEEIVAADPTFSLAYAGLADAYVLLGGRGESPPRESWDAAERAVEKAIELEPELAEPHSTRAVIRSFYRWDWTAAERDYKKALELAPGNETVRQRYSIYLSRLSRHSEAVEQMRAAREADPFSPTIAHSMGVVLYMARRFPEALDRFETNAQSMPESYRTYWYLSRCLVALGRPTEALAPALEAVGQSGGLLFLRVFEAQARAAAGDTTQARNILAELEATPSGEYVSPTSLAVLHLALNQRDEALEALGRAVQQRSGSIVWLGVDPLYDPLRGDPRFHRLLELVGLD